MATKSIRPTTRESSAYVRDKGLRPVVVTILGSVLQLRAKGLRRTEYLDIGAAYQLAVRQRVAQERAERKAARKSKSR